MTAFFFNLLQVRGSDIQEEPRVSEWICPQAALFSSAFFETAL